MVYNGPPPRDRRVPAGVSPPPPPKRYTRREPPRVVGHNLRDGPDTMTPYRFVDRLAVIQVSAAEARELILQMKARVDYLPTLAAAYPVCAGDAEPWPRPQRAAVESVRSALNLQAARMYAGLEWDPHYGGRWPHAAHLTAAAAVPWTHRDARPAKDVATLVRTALRGADPGGTAEPLAADRLELSPADARTVLPWPDLREIAAWEEALSERLQFPTEVVAEVAAHQNEDGSVRTEPYLPTGHAVLSRRADDHTRDHAFLAVVQFPELSAVTLEGRPAALCQTVALPWRAPTLSAVLHTGVPR